MNVREVYDAIQSGSREDQQQALFELLAQVQTLGSAVMELDGETRLRTGKHALSESYRLRLREFLELPKERR